MSVFDGDSGNNARFECEVDDDDQFRLVTLHDTEYKIVTTEVFDHEMQAVYKIIITCRDHGEEPRISTKPLMVNINRFFKAIV